MLGGPFQTVGAALLLLPSRLPSTALADPLAGKGTALLMAKHEGDYSQLPGVVQERRIRCAA
jgi:hypothetical protein